MEILRSVGIVVLLGLLARLSGKIDTWGALLGCFCTFVLLMGAGYLGLSLIGGFFVAGTLASLWKLQEKQRYALAEKSAGRRGWRNVAGNALLPALCGLMAWLMPAYREIFVLLAASGFAAATSDTLSSELGNVYGTRFINIISWKADSKGKDGVVSLEGSFFGVLGSGLISIIYGIAEGMGEKVFIVLIAGVAGNAVDSILGATLQRKGYLNNHTVNFLNTLSALLFASLHTLVNF